MRQLNIAQNLFSCATLLWLYYINILKISQLLVEYIKECGSICASWILHKICLHAQPLPPPSDKKMWLVPEIIFRRLVIARPSLALFMVISYKYIEYIPDISWIYHRCGPICASCTLHKFCPHAQNHGICLKHSWFWKRFNVEAAENALQRGRIPGIPRLCATDL